ncbi:hypothetical protein C2G38_2219501 [Gigaspora rosea]|uniref:Uncharacterized protein n=1 Tax=Gigaspora rosea TaxID=44941 RepID=A0A397U5E7_9GLOM|nr:hypothetical protein C2G38_2219501 [Gigaspora rosea]
MSTKTNKRWAFKIKYINNLLPTLEVLSRRNPKCNAENVIVTKIIKSCRIESLAGPNLTHARLKHILFEDTTEKGGNIERRKILLKGLINKETLQNFNRNLGLKDNQISVLCAKLVSIFWVVFYERIWKFKCEMVNEWKESQKITKKAKRKLAEWNETFEKKKKVRRTKREPEGKENVISQGEEASTKCLVVLRKALNTVKDVVYKYKTGMVLTHRSMYKRQKVIEGNKIVNSQSMIQRSPS